MNTAWGIAHLPNGIGEMDEDGYLTLLVRAET